MLFFATLFIILMMNLDNIAQVKRTPEEIKRCQKKYLDFSFKGKYIDLVGISGAAMYLEIEPEEINGYDKCFFPSFKKKNDKLYYYTILEDFYKIPFNSRGIIYKNKGENNIYYKFQNRKYDISFGGLPSNREANATSKSE